ncbi:hypothetical protein GALMADRAFT_209151 [Galerina marginata CBS 339.88]|uniref:Uncharacterized protein n=1 Tax=Galerina marginata (strain CBS 339.88) TaxID=685588 RepID=A0A067T8R4_GALM3|nr:hypothetical protein GALMADRAFT_209151 [Galerina marginata CBS 339.88]
MKQIFFLPLVLVVCHLLGCIHGAPTPAKQGYDISDSPIHTRGYTSGIYYPRAFSLKKSVEAIKNWISKNPQAFMKPTIWYSGWTKAANWSKHAQTGARELTHRYGGATAADIIRGQRGSEAWNRDDWKVVCQEIAKHARGKAYVVTGTEVQPDGTWLTVELPELQKNKAVTDIIEYRVSQKDGKLVLVGDLKHKGNGPAARGNSKQRGQKQMRKKIIKLH